MSKNIDDYLKEGMYGANQIKPDERRLFLGSLRERAAFVLTQDQVNKQQGIQAFSEAITKHPDAAILFNSQHSLNTLSPYRRIALKHEKNYTIIDEESNQHAYGVVVAYNHAVDLTEIFFKEATPDEHVEIAKKSKPTFIERLFRKK
ncbi:hypothetical protein GCM10012290_21540 [Halolactibacillus alkaliphilus]|uniref:DUF1694 domain-containing protein n=1 Tax=Halolactibacillus alkaliphilus TaxID=442899 RepID=A0A511X3G4_9BACI|nr:YueI family protein [Halolactibacillus alkaliphilus]GEN57488.1 hypothetical protein HAL01_19520 [Halolactibacillus alkaliphilus]GGN74050.1 hypothetical protein GCM10012290_21540 [Halolactibacillus alkaliphilus]SFO99907.1 Uncharacterized protein YueI [Halolactibacillus alkaliphilus]